MSATTDKLNSSNSTHYAYIEKLLASAIENGNLPVNSVLTEGQLAQVFGTSRTPVRTALNSLLDQGTLRRFEGRGFLISSNDKSDTPKRLKITRSILGLPNDTKTGLSPATSHRIESDVEKILVHALPFGQFAIVEKNMADHYGVSRTVVRELLSRLQSRGIVSKNKGAHWFVGPLTAREVAQYYAIRAKLEPLALIDSAPLFPRKDIHAMWERINHHINSIETLRGKQLDKLERDLHVNLLSKSPNTHLLRMVHESQLALVVNRVFSSFIGTAPYDISLREHAIVLEFVMRGAFKMAAKTLEEHLVLSAKRTRQRLMTLSVFPEPEFPKYLIKQNVKLKLPT